jgi:hypothetical protein
MEMGHHSPRWLTAQRQSQFTSFTRLFAGVEWRTLFAFAFPFVLYLFTLAPTIYNLDSAELTTAAATGGLTRATGYPLYLLLGRLWVQLPIGDVGYRMNLFSAVAGALTIVLAERILRRWQVGPWATLGALGLLATAPYFWAMSLVAEVYTLHTALMALIILLLLRWGEQPTPRRLAWVTLTAGLSLGHHAATVLLAPACLWYVLTIAPRQALSRRSILYATLALVAGLSIYLYLPFLYTFRPAFNYVGYFNANGIFEPINLHTLDGLWWLISGKVFAGQMMGYTGLELWRETVAFGGHLWRAFLVIGIGPGLLGAAVLLRRDWRLGGAITLMFLANAAFYINYRVIDKATMFLPAYLIWALWLAVGYQTLLDWVHTPVTTPLPSRPRSWSLAGVTALIVGLVLFATLFTWPQVDLSHDWSTRTRGETILSHAGPNAIVLGWWDTIPVVQYLQLVEGQRPDVLAINRFLIRGEDMEALIAEQAAHRPILINNPPANLLETMVIEPVGPMYRLRPRQTVRN